MPSFAATWYLPWTWFGGEEDPLVNVVRDPHYGDTLFHFYQARYFSSITGLMVSQHFERVANHADEAEVLRGGMLLSYGMHKEAGQIFAQLIEKNAAPPVRARAWYYLAKIRYQRGFLADAEDALGRIDVRLPPELDDDRVLLHANVLMARGAYADAVTVLNDIAAEVKPGKDAKKQPDPAAKLSARQYARYNLGVALVKSGDVAGGSALLDGIGRAPAANEEARALRDRANLALGFAALQDGRPADARAVLQRVRLASLQANKALLGFGWAADALKQPREALVPWTELVGRDPSDAAVLEARIAVPYALASLGAYGQSMERYNEAIDSFANENRALDESIAAVRSGKLVDGLLDRNPGEEMGWFWTIAELPELPHAGHLKLVLAQHKFQEAFKNYRDLRFLENNLDGWRDKLVVYDDMLANRKRAFEERLPKIRAEQGALGIDKLQARRDRLAGELQAAEQAADGAAFADDGQRELQRRLVAIQEVLGRLNPANDDAETARARERARLAAGVLGWNLAQDHAPRLWEAQKAMKVTDAELGEATRRDAALAQAQRDEPGRFADFAKRLALLDGRVKALIPRVAALSKEQQGEVQELAVAELMLQKERLAEYATQARFAVAQLYDRGNDKSDKNAKPAGEAKP
ncbi:MAG TPA: hypothetical protein VFR90_08625 [Methylibium sp.]|uniref:hypothetical protein n=1 Tax=Methylibium sp. TaxID=2067992 RepID=UPI002DBF381D|nr:hypothetical protein [Methylibium sp.]HEU4459170.1 hypothetical protein [Methylibium sp.]